MPESSRVDHARHWAPPWLAAVREGLDHDHAGAAAWARARQHTEGVRRDIWLLWWVSRRDDMEQCAGCRDVLSAVGVGKEPIVADAVEALGQHVHQEAPDKLVRLKPHGLPAARAVDAIVLATERDAGVVGGNEAAGSRWRHDACNGRDSAAPARVPRTAPCSGPPSGCAAARR